MSRPATTARRPAPPRRWLAVVAEPRAGYAHGDPADPAHRDPADHAADTAAAPSAAGPQGSGPEGTSAVSVVVAGVVARLEAVAEELAQIDVGALSDADLEVLTCGLKAPRGIVEGLLVRVAGEREGRAIAGAGPGKESAATRQARRQLSDVFNLTPSEAKQAGQTGRQLSQAPATADRLRTGRLRPDHARQITQLLAKIPPQRRAPVEAELIELADGCDPARLARHIQAILAREDRDAARRDEQERHRRRTGRMADTADGGLSFSGVLYGEMAERARTCIHAFRTPDAAHERRTPEQATADAFDQIFTVALRAGQAPANHGVRPHVLVVVEAHQLHTRTGTATVGPQTLTLDELAPTLADADFTRVVIDPKGIPIEVSRVTRYVPVGLWKALVVRDGGCTWPGCQAPANWCDVAHGNLRFEHGGKLRLEDCALLCRRHHRKFDNGPWRLNVNHTQVTYHRTPTNEKRRPPSRPPDTLNPADHTKPPQPPPDPPDPPDPPTSAQPTESTQPEGQPPNDTDDRPATALRLLDDP